MQKGEYVVASACPAKVFIVSNVNYSYAPPLKCLYAQSYY